jgi:ribosomal protein L29
MDLKFKVNEQVREKEKLVHDIEQINAEFDHTKMELFTARQDLQMAQAGLNT